MAITYFVVISIVFGLHAKRQTKSAGDFVKSSQGLGWVMVAFGFALIPLGAGHTISLWEQAPYLGASVLWWGIITAGIFTPIMMIWLGPIVRASGCANIPELLEKVIDKRFGRLNAGVNIATWTGIGAAETLATAAAVYGLGGHRLSEVLPGNPFVWCTLIALVLIILYVVFGGILQMALLNVINGFVMIVTVYLALGMTGVWLAANVGGWQPIKDVFDSMGRTTMTTQADLGNPALWFTLIIPVIVLHVTAGAVGQNMNLAFFASKSVADCRKGVFLGTAVNVLAAIPWTIMAIVATGIISSPRFEHLMPTLAGMSAEEAAKLNVVELAITALPPPILGLLMISLLCAVLSTGGCTLLANASILTNEIFKKALKPDMGEKTRFRLMYVSIFICAAFYAVPAFLNAVVFPVFLWCFSFGIPVFIIYVMGLKVRRNSKAAWITLVVSYAVNFWWTFAPVPEFMVGTPFELNMYPVTVVSLVLGILLPFVIPGGKPPLLKGGGFTGEGLKKAIALNDEAERLA
ncbi:MAG: hypothetical protein FWH32_05510 [Clostridiales bacterium]|nr:hypothetical protein [Clostridiales bacterium]